MPSSCRSLEAERGGEGPSGRWCLGLGLGLGLGLDTAFEMHNHNPYYTGLGLETAFEMGTIALASMVYKRMRVRIRGSGSEAVLGAGRVYYTG